MELDTASMKALSNSTRKEIVGLLSKRPYTASELSKALNKHVTTITEHLRQLEKSGMVQRKTGSKWVYYNLTQKSRNLFRPNFSWTIVFSLSFVALISGLYLVSFGEFSSVMSYSSEKQLLPSAPLPMPAPPSFGEIFFGDIFGFLLIAVGILGLTYLMIMHLRGKALTKRRL